MLVAGKLVHRNPELVVPTLRTKLVQLLTKMECFRNTNIFQEQVRRPVRRLCSDTNRPNFSSVLRPLRVAGGGIEVADLFGANCTNDVKRVCLDHHLRTHSSNQGVSAAAVWARASALPEQPCRYRRRTWVRPLFLCGGVHTYMTVI